MGSVNQSDILASIAAIESALIAYGHGIKPGIGLAAAQEVLSS